MKIKDLFENTSLLLIVLLVTGFLLLTIHFKEGESGIIHKAQDYSLIISTPFARSFSYLGSTSKDIFTTIRNIKSMNSDNRKMKQEINKLKQEIVQREDMREENERLKTLLNYKEVAGFQTKIGRVIGATLKTREKNILINLGTSSGVKKDSAVISSEGLVGVVIKSYPNSSLVRLVNDLRSGVSVQVLETRDIGVVEGTPSGRLVLRYLPFNTEVESNNKVLTSGIGGIFPKGIYVGEAEIPDKNTFRMEKEVYIKTEIDLSKLEEVLIVMNGNQQEGQE